MGINTLIRQAEKDNCLELMLQAIEKVNLSFPIENRAKFPGTYIGAIEMEYLYRKTIEEHEIYEAVYRREA